MMQGILLAAGLSSRFGANKLLQPLEDGTPLAVAAARKLNAALPGALAVVKPQDTRLAQLLAKEGLEIGFCSQSRQGMGASLAWAVSQSPHANGWLVALADMPFIDTQTIAWLAGSVRTDLDIAAPFCNGKRGHPVAFGRAHYWALTSLGGDEGARGLLQSCPQLVQRLDCDDMGVLQDIDTPADLYTFTCV